VSPYRSAVDVWLEKVNAGAALQQEVLPMRLGSFLEPFVVQEYERLTTNTTSGHDLTLHHPEHHELFGHVDRMATVHCGRGDLETGPDSYEAVLECKTCSAFRASEWGPAWSDQVPAEYLAQCLWYLGLTGCDEAHLAVLLGNTDFRVYSIKRDIDVERHMFEQAHRFWVDHVLTRQPPSAQTRSQALSLHPAPDLGLEQQASEEALGAIRRRAQAEAELDALKAEIDRLNDSIAVSMGPAERLTWQGKTLATWRLSKGATRLDTDRLKQEHPEIFERYRVQGHRTRHLRVNTSALTWSTTKE
jgi:predicted phage-related endonuclease